MSITKSGVLYQRWSAIAKSYEKEVALRELPSGRSWTFAELWAAGESRPATEGAAVFPQGNTPDFILTVIAAWRSQRVTCPLEPGLSPPLIPPFATEDSAHLKMTSGTTDAPRLIHFTPSQLVADVDNIVATMGLSPTMPNLGTISLAHSYGFSSLVLPLLLHGVPLVLISQPLPELILEVAKQFSTVALPAVPALWRNWHEANAIPPNVRIAISAGAPLPCALETAVFRHRGLKIHNFYGATECGGIAYDASALPRTDESYVGALLHNVEAKVGEDGCLAVISGAVGLGYGSQDAENLFRGRFVTSDLVELRGRETFLRGRLGDVINVAGRKLDPASVERELLKHPDILECVVFGAPGDCHDRGDMVVACYHSRVPLTGQQLRGFLLGRLTAWQLPREWWAVDSVTANPRGKTSRSEWRKRYLDAKSRRADR